MTDIDKNMESKWDADTREIIARAIHEDYRLAGANEARAQEPSMEEWDELRDDLKESNRQQADHILEKIQHIGYTVRKVNNRNTKPIAFTWEEVEIMAKMEHDRWHTERLCSGWRWGEKRDTSQKISPYIVPWSGLSEEVKEWDRRAVRNIPALLAAVGLELQQKGRQ